MSRNYIRGGYVMTTKCPGCDELMDERDCVLHAAAPALLAACKQAESAMTSSGHSVRETIDIIRAAIAKAEAHHG